MGWNQIIRLQFSTQMWDLTYSAKLMNAADKKQTIRPTQPLTGGIKNVLPIHSTRKVLNFPPRHPAPRVWVCVVINPPVANTEMEMKQTKPNQSLETFICSNVIHIVQLFHQTKQHKSWFAGVESVGWLLAAPLGVMNGAAICVQYDWFTWLTQFCSGIDQLTQIWQHQNKEVNARNYCCTTVVENNSLTLEKNVLIFLLTFTWFLNKNSLL